MHNITPTLYQRVSCADGSHIRLTAKLIDFGISVFVGNDKKSADTLPWLRSFQTCTPGTDGYRVDFAQYFPVFCATNATQLLSNDMIGF